jgi:hypothetical protein
MLNAAPFAQTIAYLRVVEVVLLDFVLAHATFLSALGKENWINRDFVLYFISC